MRKTDYAERDSKVNVLGKKKLLAWLVVACQNFIRAKMVDSVVSLFPLNLNGVAAASVRADIVGLHLPYLRAGGFNTCFILNSLCHVLGSVRSCLALAPACMRR